MNDFGKHFVCKESIAYYVILGTGDTGVEWIQIDPIVTIRKVYAPKGLVAVFTDKELNHAKNLGTPLELLCLGCFFHILRKGNRVRSAILDDKYRLKVVPWRAPCETTAIHTDSNGTYYLEGCHNTGVFWRNSGDKPKTIPPFISCGALDSNAGCWEEECPHGFYFNDDIERYNLNVAPQTDSKQTKSFEETLWDSANFAKEEKVCPPDIIF